MTTKIEDILQAMSQAFNRAALLHAEMASQHFHNMDERRYHMAKTNMEQAHCLAKAFSMEAQEMRTGATLSDDQIDEFERNASKAIGVEPPDPTTREEMAGEPVPITRGMKRRPRSESKRPDEPPTIPTKPESKPS